ncbi:unnamed protein product, partial [marine sediment metagenome]
MPYAKIEKSGCCERHGSVQIRISMYLEPGDARYDECHIQVVDTTSTEYLEGYQGKVYKSGLPIDFGAYQLWHNSLPKVWRNTSFHNHFIYADPDITDNEIKSLMDFHLPNFYKAWCDSKNLRSGWATEKRIRPLRYDEVEEPSNFALRKEQAKERVASLTEISSKSTLEGRTFPATEIDVGVNTLDAGDTDSLGDTYILVGNPANDAGTIDYAELYTYDNLYEDTKIGTFYGSSTSYTNRDYELIGDADGAP